MGSSTRPKTTRRGLSWISEPQLRGWFGFDGVNEGNRAGGNGSREMDAS